MAFIQDDRTQAQRKTHTWLVVGTDSFMSGWGEAKGGLSYAAWACMPEDRHAVYSWVTMRGDMKRVREVCDYPDNPYRPNRRCVHLHIYVTQKGCQY